MRTALAIVAAVVAALAVMWLTVRERGEEARMGTVHHLNPDGLTRNPAFTQAVAVDGPHRVIYVGGQNAIDGAGNIIGRGDVAAQTEKVFHNLQVALAAGGAGLEHVVKWNVYVVAGHPVGPALEVFGRVWGRRPNPPTISVLHVVSLAHPDFLLEIDAVAVVPEAGS